MSWPLASHFSAMLQTPRIAFRDPMLQQCRIEKDGRNQPKPWAGAFAVVYKGTAADGKRSFAVRVFTTESPERRERYDQISAYLRSRRLACLVDFEYRDRSIRSAGDGKWYPMILMDWVEGETLFRWVRGRALHGDAKALAASADRWLEVVQELADARIAHGDLQHANVMVTADGRLKLVDYDCMCVPGLVGRRNLEVGVEPYQHPDRNPTTHLALDLDNFSALVIYVALRALAADPSLWRRHVEAREYDKLLFRREDFDNPPASLLLGELRTSAPEEVRDLLEQLLALRQGRMDQVPPLPYLANSYAKVESLLSGQQWEAAVDLLNRRGQFRDAPPHLKPLIHHAYEQVCRQQAWGVLRSVPPLASESHDRRLVQAWNEPLFAGFEPAERERPRVAVARQRVAALDRLQHLVQQASAGGSLAQESSIVAAAAHLPPDYQYTLRPLAARAKSRLEAIGRLEEALLHGEGETAIAAAWRQVAQAQGERLVSDEVRRRAELALKRVPLLESLRKISPNSPPDRRDRKLLETWRGELLDDCPDAEPWREAHAAAVRRREVLKRLDDAIQRRQEVLVSQLADEPILAGYPLPAAWTGVIRAAQDRVARAQALVAALADGDHEAFLRYFDARLIRQYADRFRPYESQLCQWTHSEVLVPEQMGLKPAVARRSVVCVDARRAEYRVRWTWPQPRFGDECLLAILRDTPPETDDPRELPAVHRLLVDRSNWESGGGSRLLHAAPEWAGCQVVVWAMVDLGFRLFFSRPLVLGQIGQVKASAARNAEWHVFSSRRAGPAERPADADADPAPGSEDHAP